MNRILLSILLSLIIFLTGCVKNANSTDDSITEEVITEQNPLETFVHSQTLDSILVSLVANKTISDDIASIIKNELCKYDIPTITYSTAIELAQNYRNRIDSLNQYEKTISFPFQLGKAISIPQIITFGKKKDVEMVENYETIFLKDAVSGKNSNYSYKVYKGNDLKDLEEDYIKNRRYYYKYSKDRKFLYKYWNGTSFDFYKNNIRYKTYIRTFGNDLVMWKVECSNDLVEMYIQKYGEPICMTKDSTYCLWDFKNIRLVVTKKWSSAASFTEKKLYEEAEIYSKITKEKETEERRLEKEKAEQEAKRKAYEDSVRVARARKNDL